MNGWIGNDTFGKVEKLDDEAVVTEFWCFVLPVRPLGSYYVSHDSDGNETHTPIGQHRRSVIAGYLRTPVAMAALIMTMPVLALPRMWGHLWPYAAALIVAALWLVYGYGRLDAAERERRALLKRVLGIGAPPEMLPDQLRDELREAIDEQWAMESRPWADAIMAGAADERLVALAEYHGRRALAERARLNLSTGGGSRVWN